MARATYPRTQRAASTSAYLVLLRVEVTAFHPHDPVTRTLRLVSVALFLAFDEPRGSPYSVRELPVTLLCGARTFLHLVFNAMQRPSGQLRSQFYALGKHCIRAISSRAPEVSL